MSALHEGNTEAETNIDELNTPGTVDPGEVYRLDKQIRAHTDNTDTFIREASFQAKQKLAPASAVVVSGVAAFLAEKISLPQSQSTANTAALSISSSPRPLSIKTGAKTIHVKLPAIKQSPLFSAAEITAAPQTTLDAPLAAEAPKPKVSNHVSGKTVTTYETKDLANGQDIYKEVIPLERSGKATLPLSAEIRATERKTGLYKEAAKDHKTLKAETEDMLIGTPVYMPVTTSAAPERSIRADGIVVNLKSTARSDKHLSYYLEEGQSTWSLVKHVEANGTAAKSFEAELEAALHDNGVDKLAAENHETVDTAARHLPVGFHEELLVQTNHTNTDNSSRTQPSTTPYHAADGSGNSASEALSPKKTNNTNIPASASPKEASAPAAATPTPAASESAAPTTIGAAPVASPAAPIEIAPTTVTAVPSETTPPISTTEPTKSIGEKPSTTDREYDKDHEKAKHHKEHHAKSHYTHKKHHTDHTRSELVHGPVVNHLIGKTPAQKIFNYFFLQRGLSKVDAAGIEGNAMQESQDNPDDEGGELFQWSYAPRFNGLRHFKEHDPLHRGMDSLSLELDYAWCELNDCSYAGAEEGSVLWYLRHRDHTAATAAVRFMGTAGVHGDINGFENPGIPMQSNRIEYAEQAMREFGKEKRLYEIPAEKIITNGHSKEAKESKHKSSKSRHANPVAKATTSTSKQSIKHIHHHKRHHKVHHERRHGGSNTLSSQMIGQLIVKDAYRYNDATYEEDSVGQNYGMVWHNWFHPDAAGNFSPSAKVDCVGLAANNVDWDLFGDNVDDSTWSLYPNSLYKEVSFSQVHPGDLIEPEQYGAQAWKHPGGHVEIVTGVSGDNIYTFGAHDDDVAQPDQVDAAEYDEALGPENMFLQYVGPQKLTPEGEKLLREIKHPGLGNPVVHKLKSIPASGGNSSKTPSSPAPSPKSSDGHHHRHDHKHKHSTTTQHHSKLAKDGEVHKLKLTLIHKRKLGSHALKHIRASTPLHSVTPHKHTTTTSSHHSTIGLGHSRGHTLRLAIGHKAVDHNKRRG